MRLHELQPARIKGKGTPTSDSIPARIAETGEPLQVSNQERILSAKQEALLQQIAKLLGFESVDALLEAGTGEPVGPTIKDGKLAAATGMAPESKDLTAQLDAATKAAQAPTPAPVKPAPSPAPQGYAGATTTGQGKDLTAQLDTATKQAQAPTLSGLQAATRPVQPGETGVEMIGGVRHSTTPAVQPPALGAAAGETLNKVTGGIFDFEGRARANRENQLAQIIPANLPPAAPTAAKQAKAAEAHPTAAPINRTPLDVSKLTPEQRSTAAFAYGQGIDRATGTGPGAELARVGTDPLNRPALTDTMQKRFDAYKSNPELLAMRNAREDLLGSGIRMERDTNGGLLLTNTGNADGAVPGGGASTINMAEGNSALARSIAARQSIIDSQAARVQAGRGTYTGNGPGLSKERQEMLERALTPHKGAMNGQLTIGQLQAARGIVSDAQGEHLKGAEIAQRGDEAGQRAALEAARLAQGLPAVEGQQLQNEQGKLLAGLQKKAIGGDKEALSLLQSLGGKGEKASKLEAVQVDELLDPKNPGLGTKKTPYLLDPTTGQTRPMLQQQAIDPRAAAQAAIARGADPAAVNARLRQMGHEEIK